MHLAEQILTSKGALEGERKQVTVLFADLKGSPARANEAKAAAQKMGIRWVGCWATVGEYDAVCIIDAPNDEEASLFAL